MKVFKSKVSQHFSVPTMLKVVLGKMTKFEEPVVMDASRKGSVWLQKKGQGKILRVREPSQILAPDDVVSFYYDPHVLSMKAVTTADVIFENEHYGIWYRCRSSRDADRRPRVSPSLHRAPEEEGCLPRPSPGS